MANPNNPAGRLRRWLEAADAADGSENAITAWSRIFEAQDDGPADRVEVVQRGTMLMELGRRVRLETMRMPETMHPGVLLESFEEVEATLDRFTHFAAINMQTFMEPLKPTGWQCLRHLDAFLSTHRPDGSINDDKLFELLDQVRRMIADLDEESDLDDELRQFVRVRLQDVERALTDAEVVGTAAVEKATDALIGAFHRRPDLWDRIAGTKWAQRLGTLAGALCLALGSVGGLPALMPSGDTPPAIEQQVDVDVDVDVGVDPPRNAGDDVVDAEIVEDGAPEGAR